MQTAAPLVTFMPSPRAPSRQRAANSGSAEGRTRTHAPQGDRLIQVAPNESRVGRPCTLTAKISHREEETRWSEPEANRSFRAGE